MNEDDEEWFRDDLRLGIVIPGLPVELENMLGCEVIGLEGLKLLPITLGDDEALLAELLEVTKLRLNCDWLLVFGEGFGSIGTTDLEDDLLELELFDDVLPLLDFFVVDDTEGAIL